MFRRLAFLSLALILDIQRAAAQCSCNFEVSSNPIKIVTSERSAFEDFLVVNKEENSESSDGSMIVSVELLAPEGSGLELLTLGSSSIPLSGPGSYAALRLAYRPLTPMTAEATLRFSAACFRDGVLCSATQDVPVQAAANAAAALEVEAYTRVSSLPAWERPANAGKKLAPLQVVVTNRGFLSSTGKEILEVILPKKNGKRVVIRRRLPAIAEGHNIRYRFSERVTTKQLGRIVARIR